jgi:peptidylprolyl isomerase
MPSRILGTALIAACIVALGPISCTVQETPSKTPPATAAKKETEMTAPTAPGDIPAPPDVTAPPAGAETTPSGLASKVLQAGTGDRHPVPQDTVKVHYTGWTTDGKMFDSSVKRGNPASFPLNRVIKGWTEGLQLMVV